MKSTSQAPDPDPKIGEAALKQAETGEKWLSFAQDAFAISGERQKEIDSISKQIADLQLDTGKQSLDFAREERDRYIQTFRPIEDKFIQTAQEYGSQANQDAAAATAKADVAKATADSKQQQARQMAAVGIEPGSGSYAGITAATDMNAALASAGAQNNARTMTRDKGLALEADLVNMGRGLPTSSAQAAATGLGATTGAAGIYGSANQQYLASTQIPGQGFQGAMAGYAGMGNLLEQQYNTQVNAWSTQQQIAAQNAAGIGQAVGGIFGAILSDEELKEDINEPEDGEGLEAIREMPVADYKYKDGVADEGNHTGPMAQDFQRATGKGDGHMIPIQDMLGITMQAVQDLDRKVDRLAVGIGNANMPPKTAPKKKQPMKEAA